MIEDAIKQLEGLYNHYEEIENINIAAGVIIEYRIDGVYYRKWFKNSVNMLEWLEQNLTQTDKD